MKSAKHNFKVEELEQLIRFVNVNSPLPQQSVEETLNRLDHHTKATCLEISENFTALRGEEMQRYVDWADLRLSGINSYGYQMEISRYWELFEILEELILGKDPEPPSEEYPISHIIDETMTPEEKEERLYLSLKVTTRYIDEIYEVEKYLKQHHQIAKEVEVIAQDKEEYISTKLERRHQNLYFKMLDKIKSEKEFDLTEENENEVFSWSLHLYWNQGYEITNNFYDFSAEITGPYLAQMHKLFSQELLNLRMNKESIPIWQSFQRVIIVQLGNLCKQVENLQEKQAKEPYLKDKNKLLVGQGPFARFLLLERTGLISRIKDGIGIEGGYIEKTIALFMKNDEARVIRYMDRMEKPVTSWPKKHQRKLKRVEEYLERLLKNENYDYGVRVRE